LKAEKAQPIPSVDAPFRISPPILFSLAATSSKFGGKFGELALEWGFPRPWRISAANTTVMTRKAAKALTKASWPVFSSTVFVAG